MSAVEIAALVHDEDFPDHDGLVAAIVALALEGEPIAGYRGEYGSWGQGDAIEWCEQAISKRRRMAAREEI